MYVYFVLSLQPVQNRS